MSWIKNTKHTIAASDFRRPRCLTSHCWAVLIDTIQPCKGRLCARPWFWRPRPDVKLSLHYPAIIATKERPVQLHQPSDRHPKQHRKVPQQQLPGQNGSSFQTSHLVYSYSELRGPEIIRPSRTRILRLSLTVREHDFQSYRGFQGVLAYRRNALWKPFRSETSAKQALMQSRSLSEGNSVGGCFKAATGFWENHTFWHMFLAQLLFKQFWSKKI